MIRYKNRTFEEYSICPATGDIFDAETGEVQAVKLYGCRLCFRGMPIHRIMVHTFYGYKPGFDIHHLDENKLNNALSNLVYLTRGEHMRLHNTELLHEDTRLKRSTTMKGKSLPEEVKVKISTTLKGKTSPNKGKHHSEETKAKISAANKGKPKSEEAKAKMSAIMKGKHLSEEHKAKISAFQKGKPKSEEHKAKISASKKGKTSSFKGKPRSAETRAKISEAMRRKHAENM